VKQYKIKQTHIGIKGIRAVRVKKEGGKKSGMWG
jgi:hypothetical protein